MKLWCVGGPYDGREITVGRYLPAWKLIYPDSKVLPPETIECYQQRHGNVYEWAGSEPYYPLHLKQGN